MTKAAPWWCCLLQRVLRPDDDQYTVFKKKIIFYAGVYTAVIFTVILLNSSSQQYFTGPMLVGSALLLFPMLAERKLRDPILEAALYLGGISLILYDLRGIAAMRNRTWQGYVILVDIVFVCRLPQRAAYILITTISIWILVASTEYGLRWGLIDLVGRDTELIECDTPPCPIGLGPSFIIGISELTIFLLDFYFTRGFALRLERERESMKSVIGAAEWIAHCLSRFDLKSAEAALTTSDLPPPLHEAFHSILENLDSYRPYLPQSVLQESAASNTAGNNEAELCLPPGEARTPHPVLEKRIVSYMVTNMLDTQRSVHEATFAQRFGSYIEVLLDVVSTHRGVVGVVVGDHVHSSFNAVRRCASHAKCAVEAVLGVTGTLQNCGIASGGGVGCGEAHCGTLGSKELLTFSTIGLVAVGAAAMERVGRWHGLEAVCSGAVYKEVGVMFRMKLVLASVAVRGGGSSEGVQVLTYEVQRVEAKTAEEWMYELHDDVWERYNRVGRAFLEGREDEVKRLLMIKDDRAQKPDAVGLAEEVLLGVISGHTDVSEFVV